jgi:hypothetical protein
MGAGGASGTTAETGSGLVTGGAGRSRPGFAVVRRTYDIAARVGRERAAVRVSCAVERGDAEVGGGEICRRRVRDICRARAKSARIKSGACGVGECRIDRDELGACEIVDGGEGGRNSARYRADYRGTSDRAARDGRIGDGRIGELVDPLPLRKGLRGNGSDLRGAGIRDYDLLAAPELGAQLCHGSGKLVRDLLEAAMPLSSAEPDGGVASVDAPRTRPRVGGTYSACTRAFGALECGSVTEAFV